MAMGEMAASIVHEINQPTVGDVAQTTYEENALAVSNR
jgi:C4-dicarboxylate-specific signal transduction histidine kinase